MQLFILFEKCSLEKKKTGLYGSIQLQRKTYVHEIYIYLYDIPQYSGFNENIHDIEVIIV